MTVKELINLLNQIENKDLPIRVLENNPSNPDLNMTNFWLDTVDVANTGMSGYENSGEVILIGEE